jgi:hypothetical protein
MLVSLISGWHVALSVRVRSRGFPQMGGCYLLKYNGGDSGIKIPVLYWRCPLIRVSVIKGSTSLQLTTHSFFHSAVCLTSPQTFPKRVLHTVQCNASFFNFHYPLFSLRPFNTCLHLLPCLPIPSICSIFPSIMCFRRQFLRKM